MSYVWGTERASSSMLFIFFSCSSARRYPISAKHTRTSNVKFQKQRMMVVHPWLCTHVPPSFICLYPGHGKLLFHLHVNLYHFLYNSHFTLLISILIDAALLRQ